MTKKPKKARAKKAQPSVAERVAKHRARMRKTGMKLVQLWLPDSTNPEFQREARRQSRLVATAGVSRGAR